MKTDEMRKGSLVRWDNKNDPSPDSWVRGISKSKTYTVEDRQGDVVRVNGLLFDAGLFELFRD